jgi:anthranilate phosphoribosyltransferase
VAGKQGPVREAVLLNAAGALAAFDGPVTDLDAALSAGLERAAAAIDSGAAERLLVRWAEVSTRLKG